MNAYVSSTSNHEAPVAEWSKYWSSKAEVPFGLIPEWNYFSKSSPEVLLAEEKLYEESHEASHCKYYIYPR